MDELIGAVCEVCGDLLADILVLVGLNTKSADWGKVFMILGMVVCIVILAVMMWKY